MGEPTRKLRVLLVEDHADTAVSTVELLRLFGHEATVATDGPAALTASPTFDPDVVLLDLALPRMDGYEVARRLRALTGNGRPFLIAMTGYGGGEEQQRCAEAGINLYLLKPVDPGQLEAILAQQRQLHLP